MDVVSGCTHYATEDEAEREAEKYRKRAKVKTDVFRVKRDEQGFYIEQDMA